MLHDSALYSFTIDIDINTDSSTEGTTTATTHFKQTPRCGCSS